MDITLHIINKQHAAPARQVSLHLPPHGITVGRNPSNAVLLDDSERIISGQHARLEARDGGLWLTDLSRNGTYLNDAPQPLPPQFPVTVHHGDRVTIGTFEIRISLNAGGAELGLRDDPCAPDDAAAVPGLMNPNATPDILDLLPQRGHTAAAFTPAAPPSVEQVFYRPAEPLPDDYDLLNDAWPGALEHSAQPQPPFDREVNRGAGAAPADQRALAAFLAGLEIDHPTAVSDPEVLFHQAGALLRVFALGLNRTLMGRAQFKNELRLGVTTIRATENNPFKFAPTPDVLLTQLLLEPLPGFLPAAPAAQAAFDDIQAHEMAMTAGLQAALRALLARFEPTELERQASRGGLNPLPVGRKARCWDFFTDTYDQVAADAAEDFMQLFDDAFARAYQEQVQRLAAQMPRLPHV
jgi:type VI secretion system protein